MPNSNQRAGFRARATAVIGFLVLVALLLSWGLIEPRIRANPLGGTILEFLERPLLDMGELSLSLLSLIQTGVFLVLLGLLAGRARTLAGVFLARRSSLEEGQRYAIGKFVAYSVFVLGCIVGLQAAGINLGSLAVIGGALGIGIGFGLQESANNFLSGIVLLLERPIKVGDRIEVGNLNGDVIRIGSRATWVNTNDNITVIVPNSELVMRQVINWTATDRQVRFQLPVGVSYRSDPQQVRDALLNVAKKNTDVLDTPAPDVLFKGFGDSSLDFTLRVWTRTKVRTPSILRSDLYFEIFEELARRGIEIPYPQRDLHLRSSDVPLRIENQ